MPPKEQSYEVKEIVGEREIGVAIEYCVWWKGHPKEEATWEPAENIDSKSLITKWRKKAAGGRKRPHPYSKGETMEDNDSDSVVSKTASTAQTPLDSSNKGMVGSSEYSTTEKILEHFKMQGCQIFEGFKISDEELYMPFNGGIIRNDHLKEHHRSQRIKWRQTAKVKKEREEAQAEERKRDPGSISFSSPLQSTPKKSPVRRKKDHVLGKSAKKTAKSRRQKQRRSPEGVDSDDDEAIKNIQKRLTQIYGTSASEDDEAVAGLLHEEESMKGYAPSDEDQCPLGRGFTTPQDMNDFRERCLKRLHLEETLNVLVESAPISETIVVGGSVEASEVGDPQEPSDVGLFKITDYEEMLKAQKALTICAGRTEDNDAKNGFLSARCLLYDDFFHKAAQMATLC